MFFLMRDMSSAMILFVCVYNLSTTFMTLNIIK